MRTTSIGMPTANIAINKSRIKLYNKDESPTYYLKKGQEFQIEIFNPTKGNILAKIYLNSKSISQGGLVLRPGERVFLDRYVDVARKFKFETYTVNNTEEVRKAIEDNGDFKVEFYNERVYCNPPKITWVAPTYDWYTYTTPITYNSGTGIGGTCNTNVYNTTTLGNNTANWTGSGSLSSTSSTFTTTGGVGGEVTMDSFDVSDTLRSSSMDFAPPIPKGRTRLRGALKSKKSKSIETGTVEKGSYSSQKFDTVVKDWETWPFQTVQYKLLPISQKVNTVGDISVKRYCTECGAKTKSSFKFCPTCGNRA